MPCKILRKIYVEEHPLGDEQLRLLVVEQRVHSLIFTPKMSLHFLLSTTRLHRFDEEALLEAEELEEEVHNTTREALLHVEGEMFLAEHCNTHRVDW